MSRKSFFYEADRIGDGDVLPKSHNLPPRRLKRHGVGDVPTSVAREFGAPVGDIRLWARAVLGASVPEAAIDEYGNAAPGEDDVRTWASVCEVEPEIDSVAPSARVQC